MIIHKTRIKLNRTTYSVVFMNKKDTEFFGLTHYDKHKIEIYVNKIREFRKPTIEEVLFHELGHAYCWATIPSHAYNKVEASDVYADAFEIARTLMDDVDRIMAGFNESEKKKEA